MISFSEFNAIVFPKLGLEYNGIIGALQQRSDSISFGDFHGQLIAYEPLLKSQQPQLPMTNVVQQSTTRSSRSSWR